MSELPRVALVLTLYLALRSIAAAGPSNAAADAPFLALLTALVLLPAARLVERPATLAVASAGLVGLALVPAVGPTRAAATVLALATTLALAIGERWGRRAGSFAPSAALAAALALQALCRAERLVGLQLDVETLLDLLVLPALGAAGAVGLARRHGELSAAIVTCTLVAVGPGFTWETSLALLATGRLGVAGSGPRARWVLTLAGLAIAALAVDPWWATLLLAVGWVASSPRAGGPQLVLVLLVAGSGLVLPAVRSWSEVGGEASLLLLLLPLSPLAGTGRRRPLVLGLLLALVCLRSLPGWEPLAAPLALLALQTPRRVAGPQAAWSAGLLAVTVVAAAYPWLRPQALAAVLSALAGEARWAAAIAVSLVGLALVWIARDRRRWLLPASLVLLGIPILARSTPGAIELESTGFTLTAQAPSWSTSLPPAGSSGLILDSYVSRGLELAHGTPVATLTVRRPDGTLRRRELEIGRETADWAARRPAPAAAPAPLPAPWSSYVGPRGDFLGQIYRATWRPGGRLAGELGLERHPELPAQVELSVLAVAALR